MDILVSFCNVKMPGRPALALLEADTLKCRILQLPQLPVEVPQWLSITGLGVSQQYVYAALQVREAHNTRQLSQLIVFDRADLRLLSFYPFHAVAGVHSLWVSGERLYVVSTGTDEVIELHMQGAEVTSERVFWRPTSAGPRADIHHLNAIYSWRGDLLVSGFGQKTSDDWNLTRDGFIFNITRGEKIASGLLHPHSLVANDGTIAYCESQKMAVRAIGRAHIQYLPGYTRGLCRIGQKLFVGTSLERQVSVSTGKLRNQNALGIPVGRCAVSRLSANSFEIEDTIDLTTYSDEIYDLLPIEGTERWPVVSNARFESAEATRHKLISLTMQEVAATIPPGNAFILIDDQVFGEEVSAGRAVIPFLERDGQYWGRPADDLTAIGELERLRRLGARFMVVVWPAFWWLDYYAGFHRYLRSQFRGVLQNDRLVIFDLRP